MSILLYGFCAGLSGVGLGADSPAAGLTSGLIGIGSGFFSIAGLGEDGAGFSSMVGCGVTGGVTEAGGVATGAVGVVAGGRAGVTLGAVVDEGLS